MDLSQGTHILRFTAEWCGPCRVYGPIFDDVVKDYPDTHVHIIDVDKDTATAQQFNIMSIPSTIVVKDGETVSTKIGSTPKPLLKQFLDTNI